VPPSTGSHHQCAAAYLRQVPGRTRLRLPHSGQNAKRPRPAAGLVSRSRRPEQHCGFTVMHVHHASAALSRISGSSQAGTESLSRERDQQLIADDLGHYQASRAAGPDGRHSQKLVYGFLRRCGPRRTPSSEPARAVPHRSRQGRHPICFSGVNRSCIVGISATLPPSEHQRQSPQPSPAGRPPRHPIGTGTSPRQNETRNNLSPAENISTICIESSGKPASRSCNLSFRPSHAGDDSIDSGAR